jgi:hypothetical protein
VNSTSCGCVWEHSEEYGVIVSACAAHLVPRINGEPIPDGEDRLRWILDQELDQLVTAANKGKRIEGLRPPDPTRAR